MRETVINTGRYRREETVVPPRLVESPIEVMLENALVRINDKTFVREGWPEIDDFARCVGGTYYSKDIRVDFVWPDCRLVVECDGWAYHNTHAAFCQDRLRDRVLQRMGWTVLHFSGSDITLDADGCATEIAQHLYRLRAINKAFEELDALRKTPTIRQLCEMSDALPEDISSACGHIEESVQSYHERIKEGKPVTMELERNDVSNCLKALGIVEPDEVFIG